MAEDGLMNEHREMKVAELHELVEHGDYRVDPSAVADALMRRPSGQYLAREYAELTSDAPDGLGRSRIRGTTVAGTDLARATALAA